MTAAVIFDVDGTLLDTERLYVEAWRQAGRMFGYAIPDEALIETRAVGRSVAVSVFQKYCGEDFPYEDIRLKRNDIAESVIAKSSVETLMKPGTEKVLHTLENHGLLFAAASSTEYSKTCDHLERVGLLKYFSVVIGGDMVKHGKPDPEIFLMAAQQLNLTPSECTVVGDTPADVYAASAAGMDVYLIPDLVPVNEETSALSRCVLSCIKELTALLVADKDEKDPD